MDPIAGTPILPEVASDVPGVCTVSLTRAVVQYRDVHELDHHGGRIEDIGLALVVDGRYAAASEAVDLGSGRSKTLDLSTELVVLDWAYDAVHAQLLELLRRPAEDGDADLRRYAFRLACRVLERVGFGPLTRPVLLRIGFRDLCRDLDLHEGTSIRLQLGHGRIVRAHLDYDACAVSVRSAVQTRDPQFERALAEAFPDSRLRFVDHGLRAGGLEYRVHFALPTSFEDARTVLGLMRRGFTRLIARYEPDRFAQLSRLARTFGDRETLALLRIAGTSPEADVVVPSGAALRAGVVGTVH